MANVLWKLPSSSDTGIFKMELVRRFWTGKEKKNVVRNSRKQPEFEHIKSKPGLAVKWAVLCTATNACSAWEHSSAWNSWVQEQQQHQAVWWDKGNHEHARSPLHKTKQCFLLFTVLTLWPTHFYMQAQMPSTCTLFIKTKGFFRDCNFCGLLYASQWSN